MGLTYFLYKIQHLFWSPRSLTGKGRNKDTQGSPGLPGKGNKGFVAGKG